MGADLSGNNGAAFDLAELQIYGGTVVGAKAKELCEYFEKQPLNTYGAFAANQWMRVTDGPTRGCQTGRLI
jgi:hypothetical protein